MLVTLSSTAGAADSLTIESRARVVRPEAMATLLSRGEVALIEQEGADLKQAVLFALMDGPPEKVYDLIWDVAAYPEFLSTMESTRVLRSQKNQLEFHWKLDVPLISLQGTRMQRGKRPWLIEARHNRGNFNGSRERWELFPVDGGERTLVACYRVLNTETGGLVIKTLANLEPLFRSALSIASSYVHVRSLQRQLQGLPQLKASEPRTGQVPPFVPLRREEDLSRVAALMKLGHVAIIESHSDGALRQVSLVTSVEAPKDRMQTIAKKADDYPKFIPNFAEQKMHSMPEAGGKYRLEWELEVPFSNLEGESLMTVEPDGSVDIVNTKGDVPRGRFRWEFVDLGPRRTVPVHYTYTDIRQASFFTKMLLKKQPLFEHGAVIAAGTIALAAFKERAEGRR